MLRQAGPRAMHGPIQFGAFGAVQFAAFRNRQRHIVDLLDVDHAGNRGRDRRIAQDVTDGQTRQTVVLFFLRIARRAVAFEQRVACKRLDAEEPAIALFHRRVKSRFVRRQHLGPRRVGRDDHVDHVRKSLHHVLQPGQIVGRDPGRSRLARLLGSTQPFGNARRLGFGMRKNPLAILPPAAVDRADDPVQIDVILVADAERILEHLHQRVAVALAGAARLAFVPRPAQVHLVAAAFQSLAVRLDLRTGAGVDIVDAPLDATGDDVVPVLLKTGVV